MGEKMYGWRELPPPKNPPRPWLAEWEPSRQQVLGFSTTRVYTHRRTFAISDMSWGMRGSSYRVFELGENDSILAEYGWGPSQNHGYNFNRVSMDAAWGMAMERIAWVCFFGVPLDYETSDPTVAVSIFKHAIESDDYRCPPPNPDDGPCGMGVLDCGCCPTCGCSCDDETEG